MKKLNKRQLVVCWIISIIVSVIIIYPSIEQHEHYRFRSIDGWTWSIDNLYQYMTAKIDENGKKYLVSQKSPDGTTDRIYYFDRLYYTYSLDTNSQIKLCLILLLNGGLLVYSLGNKKNNKDHIDKLCQ